MISKTMGRRYSKALMALALERSEPLNKLQGELSDFSAALTADTRLMHLLTNPNVLLGDRLKALDKVLRAFEARQLVAHLSQLLLRKGRIEYIHDISREFRRLVDRQNGVARARVIFAREPSPDELEKVRGILHVRFNKEIILSVTVDPELIGGLIIKIGSLSFDGSIRSQLKAIQSQLLEEVPFS